MPPPGGAAADARRWRGGRCRRRMRAQEGRNGPHDADPNANCEPQHAALGADVHAPESEAAIGDVGAWAAGDAPGRRRRHAHHLFVVTRDALVLTAVLGLVTAVVVVLLVRAVVVLAVCAFLALVVGTGLALVAAAVVCSFWAPLCCAHWQPSTIFRL